MKKNFFFIATVSIALLAINATSSAQLKTAEEPTKKSHIPNTIDAATEFTYMVAKNSNLVHTKAARNFSKSFKMVTDVTWFEVTDGFRAQFETAGKKTWVDYNKKGNWLHTIRIYDEKQLPQNVRHQVKSTYYDHVIKLIHEIELPVNVTYYIIHLEGEKTLIDLRLYDGEMEIIKELIKG